MKITNIKWIAQSMGVVALMTVGVSAFAATTWSENLTGSNTSPNVTLSAYSSGTGTKLAPSAIAGSDFVAATVMNYGDPTGLGISGGTEYSAVTGPHAIDNAYGIDAMVLNFTDGPVNLSSLSIGWNGSDCVTTTDSNSNGTKATGCNNSTYGSRKSGTATTSAMTTTYNDSDLSVFAWTGIAGKTPTSTVGPDGLKLANSGWTWIGNYADVGLSNGKDPNSANPGYGGAQAVTTSIYSSYWLISAYSNAYGSGNGLDQGNDAFKLLTIAGNTCSTQVSGNICGPNNSPNVNVPEPGSIALLGLGLIGLLTARRRNEKAD